MSFFSIFANRFGGILSQNELFFNYLINQWQSQKAT